MVMIFKDTYEDLTPRQLEYIIERFEAGKGGDIQPGTQIDRVYSAPFGGMTTLTSADEPAAAAPVAAKAAEEAVSVPPSNAGHPKTDAIETAPAIKSPADGKTATPGGEPVKSATAAESSSKPSLDDASRPAGIEKPAVLDDLKLISGVGPKIEGTLHSLGIFTFAQIVSWNEEQRAWVDGYLNFKGRIDRDEWVKQAEALARGGEEEYIKVFGKKPR
jgi:NADH-quinone oxidoreductase subunit E